MALVYAFTDDTGKYHGEENDRQHAYEFEYTPTFGPFTGQRLTVHAASWDGSVSEHRLPITPTWSVHATEQVAEILWPDRDHRPGT